MAQAVESDVETGDLKREWLRSGKSRRNISLLLVAPLFIYVLVTFMLPIGLVLYRSVENSELAQALPLTATELSQWRPATPGDLPPDTVFATFSRELADAERHDVAELARRLNYEISGLRTIVMSTARKIRSIKTEPADEDARQMLIEIDPHWNEPTYWHAMKRAAPHYTPYYLLAALDLRHADDGTIVRAPEDQRTFVDILLRTLRISAIVTLVALLLGFPYANLMATSGKRFALFLMIAVMLPFWTSLLARTSAWIVMLQKEGLINTFLGYVGLIDRPLELIFNTTGLYIVMVHMMLPFMVLPIFATMKGIPPHFMRASASLGAHPMRGFLHVYLPMTLPGVGAGALLTFIVTAGYYITPSLVASARDQMIGYFIAFFIDKTINWGMASALGIMLLVCVAAIYMIAARTVGVRQLAGLR
ncbi:ABC transporter permease [Aquamicrobium segne]|uniref:ABC transporter permease n=2 Tax=Aquamicrobium segne TaxID=469547 RepID=A0ABW0GZR2_9HYPH